MIGRLGRMFRSPRRRNLICFALLVAACAGSLLVVPGIRHRHDGGGVAHTHAAGGHGHSHTHGHGHSHSHAHAHTHSHEHDDHQSESERSERDDVPAEESSSHIHVSFFGFELTLPDFLNDQPAPLVQLDQDNQGKSSGIGDVIELPSPFSFAQLMDITLRWTAIGCSFVQIEGNETSFCRTAIRSDFQRGIDPSAPLLPPPEAP